MKFRLSVGTINITDDVTEHPVPAHAEVRKQAVIRPKSLLREVFLQKGQTLLRPHKVPLFGSQRVFDVVDKRLLTGKPMIVTTNIPLSVMKQAADLDDRRIFDRILEVCVPIRFDGDSSRKSTAADNLKKAARLLG